MDKGRSTVCYLMDECCSVVLLKQIEIWRPNCSEMASRAQTVLSTIHAMLMHGAWYFQRESFDVAKENGRKNRLIFPSARWSISFLFIGVHVHSLFQRVQLSLKA
jgi:hypothetical protein